MERSLCCDGCRILGHHYFTHNRLLTRLYVPLYIILLCSFHAHFLLQAAKEFTSAGGDTFHAKHYLRRHPPIVVLPALQHPAYSSGGSGGMSGAGGYTGAFSGNRGLSAGASGGGAGIGGSMMKGSLSNNNISAAAAASGGVNSGEAVCGFDTVARVVVGMPGGATTSTAAGAGGGGGSSTTGGGLGGSASSGNIGGMISSFKK